MYFNGDGVENDDKVAARWFEQAAIAGHAGAQDILVYIDLNGRGVASENEQKPALTICQHAVISTGNVV